MAQGWIAAGLDQPKSEPGHRSEDWTLNEDWSKENKLRWERNVLIRHQLKRERPLSTAPLATAWCSFRIDRSGSRFPWCCYGAIDGIRR